MKFKLLYLVMMHFVLSFGCTKASPKPESSTAVIQNNFESAPSEAAPTLPLPTLGAFACQKENLQVADMNFNSKLVVDETNEKVLTRWKKIFTTDDCFNELILVTELGEIMNSKKNWREIIVNQTYVKLKNSLVVIAFNQYRICDIDSWVLNKDQLIGEGEQASNCPFRPRAIKEFLSKGRR